MIALLYIFDKFYNKHSDIKLQCVFENANSFYNQELLVSVKTVSFQKTFSNLQYHYSITANQQKCSSTGFGCLVLNRFTLTFLLINFYDTSF